MSAVTELPPREHRLVPTALGPVDVISSPAAAGAPKLPPLLVLHGMNGDNRQVLGFLDRLEGRFEIHAVSRPGYGKTPISSGRGSLAQAELYVALLDALGIEKVVVLGVSAGGPSTLAFAINHPDRCAGIIQFCAVSGHLIKGMKGTLLIRVAAKIPPLWDYNARLESRKPITAHGDNDLTPHEAVVVAADPEMKAELETFMLQMREGVLYTKGMRDDVATFMACIRRGAPTWPTGVQLPGAVVHGGADPTVSVAHAEWHAQLIPGAQLTIVPEVGHLVALTAVAPCIDAVNHVYANLGE